MKISKSRRQILYLRKTCQDKDLEIWDRPPIPWWC